MSVTDWLVIVFVLLGIILYGLYKSHTTKNGRMAGPAGRGTQQDIPVQSAVATLADRAGRAAYEPGRGRGDLCGVLASTTKV